MTHLILSATIVLSIAAVSGAAVEVGECAKCPMLMRIAPDGKSAKLTWNGQGLFKIEYTVGGQVFKTHYLYGEPPFAWSDYNDWTR